MEKLSLVTTGTTPELELTFQSILFEHDRAKKLFPKNFANQHEAIAVIREEYIELEKEIFLNQKNYNLLRQRKEAIQLAAMCVRLVNELL
jgi:hypothetical protein